MKKVVILLLCLGVYVQTFAQRAVQWSVVAVKVNDGKYSVDVKVAIEKGWYVYGENDAASEIEAVNIFVDGVELGVASFNDAPLLIDDGIFGKRLRVFKNDFSFTQELRFNGVVPNVVMVRLKGFAANKDSFIPIDEVKEVTIEGGSLVEETIKIGTVNLNGPASECGDESVKGASIGSIFLKGIIGGLIALLMPCLFPMIPLTVSFFTNRAGSRSQAIRYSSFYGLSILFIYILASLPFHLLSGLSSQLFNTIATNAWVNLAFFVVFLLFALSLFGLFELRLPAALSNKASSQGHLRSLTGIFFMALTLVIVSFSCTGPILGTLLVGSLSSEGNPWELTAGMAGFGVALALPFSLFALFPSWLKLLPKSGGWLDTMKKSLAFVELALAFKFLSNADLVEHWGLLKREVFIVIWIVITTLLGLYLLGVFDRREKPLMTVVHPKLRTRWVRPSLATLCFLFAIYLLPGITNTRFANLKLVSGFPPPLTYSIYKHEASKGVEPDVVNDYEKALQLSKQTGKPILIDFTGWACVNCRKMEEQVWTEPSVSELIKDKFILVSLYVDDRAKLPQQFKVGDKVIQTAGDKWAAFQSINFGGASQPMYVVLSPSEELMNRPIGYSAPNAYEEWLRCGLDAWSKQKLLAFKP